MGIYSHQEMTDTGIFNPQTIAKLKPEEFAEHSYCALCKQHAAYFQLKIPLGMAQKTRPADEAGGILPGHKI